MFLLTNIDYTRDLKRSTDALEEKYREIASAMNRLSQGNLSRNEVASLYSQARRFTYFDFSQIVIHNYIYAFVFFIFRIEVDGKQYMEQLTSKQNASLVTMNSSSGLPEEVNKIK